MENSEVSNTATPYADENGKLIGGRNNIRIKTPDSETNIGVEKVGQRSRLFADHTRENPNNTFYKGQGGLDDQGNYTLKFGFGYRF